jgi:thimet oligopeptidase
MQNHSSQIDTEPGWHSPEEVAAAVERHLQASRSICETLLKVEGERTVHNTLELYNDLLIEIDRIFGLADLIGNVHPNAEVRAAANAAFQKLAQYLNELKLNRAVYDALNQIKTDGLEAETARCLEHALRDYRRSGVDQPEPVRRELTAIYEQMVSAGQEFSKNIREGERYIEIGPADLAGLPADFVASHQAGPQGRIKITTAYADYDVFMKYSPRADLRQALYRQFQTRAYPENEGVLKKLLNLRHRYAELLGYPSWAEYSAEDKMVKQAGVISDFIDRVEAMARPRSQQDLAVLLKRKKSDQPAAQAVDDWDSSYYVRKVREEQFGVDAQVVRAYFEYPRVKDGLLRLSEELYSVKFVPAEGVEVWALGVEVYDALDSQNGGSWIGRIYLDLFPRQDKFSHVATFPGQTGMADRQVAQVAMVGNFPGPGTPGQPAFWEHGDVDTFLHEFGHVMHALLSYRHHWVTIAGLNCQWDFVEVPSQLYEEWAWDAAVLARFAIHHQTGQPIPADLVARLKQSSEFGKGLSVSRQMAYARLSLFCHDHNPAEIDLLESWRQIARRYSPFPFAEGTYTYTSFGHLEGYSSMYYCYMWSLSLVKDLLTRFQAHGLMDRESAFSYRQTVLEQGGARDGAAMVKAFLDRDFSFEAFREWVEKE